MNIPAAIFGVLVVAAGIAAMVFVISVSASQPTYTDSYSGVLSNTSNTSSGLVGNVTMVGQGAAVPIVLIAGVILFCVVIFAFYIAAKQFVP